MIYYVSTNGCDTAAGTPDAPFRTINHAASIAAAGDTVRVSGGVYREYVDPKNAGKSNECRIIYEAQEGERPIIKGSEIVTGWEPVTEKVWHKSISNTVFGDFNPFAISVFGDWLAKPVDRTVHLGDVYLNGVSLYEAYDMDSLHEAKRRISGEHFEADDYTHTEYIREPENTVYQWYANVNEETTELYCNFGEYDPNCETVEISVRQCCFFPSKTGINYITVRGFEMAHSATQFAPPTADQYGMIGPHWSCGWIIEDNVFHDAKCCAVSLGKICDGNGNKHTRLGCKAGYFHQLEEVYDGLRAGWKKGLVGSHTVRNNLIYNCGQAGIVGHMGGAFSVIDHNHIYNVNAKQEFWGHEVAGIKLHAAIDTVIKNNNIHTCNLGIWLDWQAQGARITGNLFYDNARDLFIEVTHGPMTVDNNILLSPITSQNMAQGTAYVNNLMSGLFYCFTVPHRSTPYHLPHSTEIAGAAAIYGGDDRIYNNIILGAIEPYSEALQYVGKAFDSFTTPEERKSILEYGTPIDFNKLINTPQPVWVSGNAYAGYSAPFRKETEYLRVDGISADITADGAEWVLSLYVPDSLASASFASISAQALGKPILSECSYDDSDGSPVDLSRDILGNKRGVSGTPGPFSSLVPGLNRITVWHF